MQTVSAGAAISVITLPDQTKVTLNRYSSLTYRIVSRRIGGEYNYREKLISKWEKDARHPFVVKADPVEVEVLGTHFNVEAYPGDAEVKTTLLEGSVAVNAPAVSSRITLSPGESAIYNRADKTLQEEKTKRK